VRRDYKFSSVIIIQIIVTLILVLIVSLTGAYANSDFNTGSSILNTILTTAVQTIFGFIIARGLVFNRMGSLGEYFDNFNYLTLKLFGLCFIISILISIFIFLIYFKYKKKNYDRQAKKRKIKDKENFNNKKEYKFEKKVNDNRLLLECYKNLGFKVVPVSFEQVKNQYMNLVKENHPDRGGDIETMQKINEAYEEAKSKFGK